MGFLKKRTTLYVSKGVRRIPMPTALLYTSTDPYAVRLNMEGTDRTVPWTISRQLLRDGVQGAKGEVFGDGDFQILRCTCPHSKSDGSLHMDFGTPDTGYATVHGNVHTFRDFVEEIYELVPEGTEDTYYDMDDVIAKLLSS